MSSGRHGWLALVAALALAAGCGDAVEPTPVPTAGPDSPNAPALLTEPKQEGEIVVSGEASPESHGPFKFDGRYRVRFAQFEPQDPDLDFSQETSFEAELGPQRPGPRAKWIKLFRKAAASGERTMDISGRHTVDVNFGDYPYVVRFSPWRE
jgi:hypothetical protein